MDDHGILKLIEARYEAVNAHDWSRFQAFYADSITWDDSGLPEPIKGPAAVRERLEVLVTAFPDLHWHLDQLFGDGENVCAKFTFSGTHKGELPDNYDGSAIPPTGKTIRVQACGVYQVQKGKIVDSVVYFDFGALTR